MAELNYMRPKFSLCCVVCHHFRYTKMTGKSDTTPTRSPKGSQFSNLFLRQLCTWVIFSTIVLESSLFYAVLHISFVCVQEKVSGIYTIRSIARMADFHPFRNRTIHPFPSESMREKLRVAAIASYNTIPVALTASRPKPAIISFVDSQSKTIFQRHSSWHETHLT